MRRSHKMCWDTKLAKLSLPYMTWQRPTPTLQNVHVVLVHNSYRSLAQQRDTIPHMNNFNRTVRLAAQTGIWPSPPVVSVHDAKPSRVLPPTETKLLLRGCPSPCAEHIEVPFHIEGLTLDPWFQHSKIGVPQLAEGSHCDALDLSYRSPGSSDV